MRTIDPGHKYSLRMLDAPRSRSIADAEVVLTFVKREGEGYPGNEGHYPGTTSQEVLRALIDRAKYVDGQIHDDRNDRVIRHLREAIFELEMRAAERHGRVLQLFDMDEIELLSTCEKCNHIGCWGECHP